MEHFSCYVVALLGHTIICKRRLKQFTMQPHMLSNPALGIRTSTLKTGMDQFLFSLCFKAAFSVSIPSKPARFRFSSHTRALPIACDRIFL